MEDGTGQTRMISNEVGWLADISRTASKILAAADFIGAGEAHSDQHGGFVWWSGGKAEEESGEPIGSGRQPCSVHHWADQSAELSNTPGSSCCSPPESTFQGDEINRQVLRKVSCT